MKRLDRVLRVLMVAALLAAIALLMRRNDFVALIGALVAGNSGAASVACAALAALIGAVLWRRLRAHGIAVEQRTVAVLILSSLAVAGVEWSRQSAGLQSESVQFMSDGDTLYGTIVRPDSGGPYPGIVIAQGSLNLPHRSYAPLATALARQGFVVLNYDRRGVGRSGGGDKLDARNNAGAPYIRQLGRDLAAAAVALRAAPRVIPSNVGLYGISQGGWVILLAAAQDSQIAFALIVSGPTTSTREEGIFSAATGEDDDHFARRPPRMSLADADAVVDTATPGGFDPRTTLGELHLPVRWMMGAWDNSVPVTKSVRIVDSLARLGKPFRAVVFPQANHGLMIARGPRARMTPYWDAGVWDTTVTWLRELSRR